MDNLVVTLLAGGVYLGAGCIAHGLMKRESRWEALGVPLGSFLTLLLTVSTFAGSAGGYGALASSLGNGALGPFAFLLDGGLEAVAGVLAGITAIALISLPGFRPAWWSFAASSLAAITWVACGWAGAALTPAW
jgi:hypothetical protein